MHKKIGNYLLFGVCHIMRCIIPYKKHTSYNFSLKFHYIILLLSKYYFQIKLYVYK